MAAKGGLGRVEVVRVEGGHNDATTYRVRAGLARAAELGVEDLAAYLDGEIELDDALGRRRASSEPQSARHQAAELAREDGVYEPAIQAVLTEPIPAEHAGRSRLWWADRMRYRAQEMLRSYDPGAPVHATTATPAAPIRTEKRRKGEPAGAETTANKPKR